MKPSHKIAYNYAQAMLVQETYTATLNNALASFCGDNAIYSLSEPIEGAYTNLVQELLGSELWEWLQWWMWTTDWGRRSLEFEYNNQQYVASNMTLYSFLEVVDASA